MNATRREFVRLGLGSCTLLACGTSVPGFLARSALAAPRAIGQPAACWSSWSSTAATTASTRSCPTRDDAYARHRPRLRIPAGSLHKLDDHVGLHPALDRISTSSGNRASWRSCSRWVIPTPNRSHFESMAIWQTGDARARCTTRRAGSIAASGRRRGGRPTATARPSTSATASSRAPARRRPLRPLARRARPARAADRACPSAATRRPIAPPSTASRACRAASRARTCSSSSAARSSPTPAAPGSSRSSGPDGRGASEGLPRLRAGAPAAARGPAHQGGALDLDLLRPARGVRYALRTSSTTMPRCSRELGGAVSAFFEDLRRIERSRPRAAARLLGVRSPADRERQPRHRPRHRRARAPRGPARPPRPARPVSRT